MKKDKTKYDNVITLFFELFVMPMIGSIFALGLFLWFIHFGVSAIVSIVMGSYGGIMVYELFKITMLKVLFERLI